MVGVFVPLSQYNKSGRVLPGGGVHGVDGRYVQKLTAAVNDDTKRRIGVSQLFTSSNEVLVDTDCRTSP
jgi:hypothetical protein